MDYRTLENRTRARWMQIYFNSIRRHGGEGKLLSKLHAMSIDAMLCNNDFDLVIGADRQDGGDERRSEPYQRVLQDQ